MSRRTTSTRRAAIAASAAVSADIRDTFIETPTPNMFAIKSLIVDGPPMTAPDADVVDVDFNNAGGTNEPRIRGRVRIRVSRSNEALYVTYDPELEYRNENIRLDSTNTIFIVSTIRVSGRCAVTIQARPFENFLTDDISVSEVVTRFRNTPNFRDNAFHIRDVVNILANDGAHLIFGGEPRVICDRLEINASNHSLIRFTRPLRVLNISASVSTRANISGLAAMRELGLSISSEGSFANILATTTAQVTIHGEGASFHSTRITRDRNLDREYLFGFSNNDTQILQDVEDSDYIPETSRPRRTTTRRRPDVALDTDSDEQPQQLSPDTTEAELLEHLAEIRSVRNELDDEFRSMGYFLSDPLRSEDPDDDSADEDDDWVGRADQSTAVMTRRALEISAQVQEQQEQKRKEAEEESRRKHLEELDLAKERSLGKKHKRKRPDKDTAKVESSVAKKSGNGGAKDCCICSDPLGEIRGALNCGHTQFCYDCARKVFVKFGVCPLCRAVLTDVNKIIV